MSGTRRRGALLAALGLATFLAGCAGRRVPEPGVEPRPDLVELQLASFEHAWQRIRDTYPHADFRGLDWDGVREELLPRAEGARSAAQLRPVIEDMLSRLGESHFQVIPAEAFAESEETSSPAPDDVASAPGAASPLEPPTGDIGLAATVLEDDVVVFRVAPDGPAARGGVRPGHRILEIDGGDVRRRLRATRRAIGDTPLARLQVLSAVTALLQAGPPGSEVELVLGTERGGRWRVTLERAPRTGVPVKVGHAPRFVAELHDELLRGEGVEAGYVRFNVWMTPVAGPFTEAIRRFVEHDVDGVIIDLRGNPGGIGGMVMGLAGHFIDEQGVSLGRMTLRGAELDFVANPRAVSHDGPLAILVDDLSVSTSELFASGMQDVGRARVFGTRSPGMALPSVVERLPNDDRLQFVIADLETPSGRRIEGQGVVPDEPVELTRDGLLAGRDEVLQAAMRWIAAETRDTSGR